VVSLAKKEESLTIFIGRDSDKDIEELFSKKPFKEIDQPRNALYLNSFEELHRLLSPAKLDLLRALITYHPKSCEERSVSEIAKETHRHQEAISRDLSSLKKIGLVSTKAEKQKVFAKPEIKSICIRLR
jgi:predicted transcriptional regulator